MDRTLLYINLLLSFISFSQVNNPKVSPIQAGAFSSSSISYVVGKIYVIPEPISVKKKNEENIVENNTVIYPNPVTDLITIKSIDKLETKSISLIDMKGKIIYFNNIKNNVVDLSFLERGFYIVILDDDKTKIFKIIKN